ncbi:MAG: glycosyltransferase family 2 protein [Rothia sp. (in: high G+C Gram-positive bacteria)]|nr:glycosyltransferase family 2 protein [Rothia sp. (in: high G+C Gram-positive bacteria)]
MRSLPKVSAVIPHYGDAGPTTELVKALQEQTYGGELEVIVADDNSPKPFPCIAGVNVVHRAQNGGFGANVNSGVNHANGEYLLILNSDLILSATFVEKAVHKLEELGDVLLSPMVVDETGEHQWVGRKFPTTFQAAWEWFTPFARFKKHTWWHRGIGHDVRCLPGKTQETDWVVGACMVMRTDTFRKLGGMDESFFMNSEEVDFQYRMKQHNLKRYYAGDLQVQHIGGASSGDYQRRRQWVVDSRFRYAQKWGVNPHLKLALTAVSGANFIFNGVRSLRNDDVNPLKILREELKYLERTA